MEPSATTIVQVLNDLSPSDVLNSNDIKQAFEGLINRGDPNFCSLVSKMIKSRAVQHRRRRSGDACEDRVTDRARHYFNNRPQKKQVVLLRALKGLRSGSEKPADFYTGPWFMDDDIFRGRIDDEIFRSPGIDAPSRVNCLLEAHARIERDTILNQFMRRVNLVYIAYEVGRLEQTAVPPAKERRVTAATKQLAEQTGFSVAHINDLRWRGRGYTKLMDIWGPGALCVIGESVKDIWENVLTNGEITDLIGFCDKHVTVIAERAKNLNDVTGRAICSGLQRYGGDLDDFQRHDSILLRCLRKHCPGLLSHPGPGPSRIDTHIPPPGHQHQHQLSPPAHHQLTLSPEQLQQHQHQAHQHQLSLMSHSAHSSHSNSLDSSPEPVSAHHQHQHQHQQHPDSAISVDRPQWGRYYEGRSPPAAALGMGVVESTAPGLFPTNILNATWLDDFWPSVHNGAPQGFAV